MNLYFRTFGQGYPIIILHGLFGFSDNWQTIAKELAKTHLVITPDLRNHGRSPHVNTHNYKEMAEDVLRMMHENGIYEAIVLGHSMGGKVAMQLALDHPDAVELLLVVDIDPFQSDDNQSIVLKALHAVELDTMTERSQIEAVLRQYLHDPGVIQFLLKNVTREADGSFTWKMNLPVLAAEMPNIYKPVNGSYPYEKPTLFIRGSRSDYIKDMDFAFTLHLFPQARLVTIEDAGHWVHAEKPKELLEAVQEFILN